MLIRTSTALLLYAGLAFGAEPSRPALGPALVRLGRALTFPTVSSGRDSFARFHAFLRESFPLVHRDLSLEVIGDSALLFRWRGSRADLKPIVLAAHQDVAAVEESTATRWKHAPFSGEIAEGCVWGRGARDFKPGLMAILESVEALLREGFVPARDIYLAFGDDEETQGYGGAGRIARRLAQAGVKAEFVLDEGGGIQSGLVSGIPPGRPVAFIGVAEKGYLSVELSVEGPGGHSSLPSAANPILVLGQALQKLAAHPFPATIQEPVPSMLRSLGEASGSWQRFVYTHLWLTGGLVRRIMAGNPNSEAMLRTTLTATRFESGVQDNVVPSRVVAVVNLRLLPGWSISKALQHLTRTIDDPRVKLAIRGRASEAPAVAPTNTASYALLAAVIRATFPGAVIAPFMNSGATDIRHYAGLSKNLYRFAPSVDTRAFSGNGHGIDERLPASNYGQYLAFYTTLLRSTGRAFPGITR